MESNMLVKTGESREELHSLTNQETDSTVFVKGHVISDNPILADFMKSSYR